MKKPLKILVATWEDMEIEEAIRDFGNDVRTPGYYNVSTVYGAQEMDYNDAVMEMIKKETPDVVVMTCSILTFQEIHGSESFIVGLTCGELMKFIRLRNPKMKIILLSHQKVKLMKKMAKDFAVEADVFIQIKGPLADYFSFQKEGMGWLIFKKVLENIHTKVFPNQGCQE